MTPGQAVALAVALAAPVVAVLTVVVGRPPRAAVHRVQAGAVVSAVAWVLLLVTGARGRAGLFHVSPLVAAGGCGAALLTAAGLEGARRNHRALAGTGLALAALGAGLAGGSEGVQVVVLVGGLALAAAASIDATPTADRAAPAVLALPATLAVAIGAVVLHIQADRWDLPETGTVPLAALGIVLAAAAALVVAGTVRCRRPTAVLAAGGLVLGLAAAPLRPGADELAGVAIVLALAALAAAAAARAPAALGLLALAAAAGPAALTPASRLLAAAGVVAGAVDRPVAWLAAVPGGVALAAGVVDDGGWLASVLALATSAVAVLLARTASRPTSRGAPTTLSAGDEVAGSSPGPLPTGLRPRVGSPMKALAVAASSQPWLSPGVVPALVVGAWLLLAPGSWAWTGADLGAYDRGLGRGVAAGLLVVVVSLLAAELRRIAATQAPPRPRARPRTPPRPKAPPPRRERPPTSARRARLQRRRAPGAGPPGGSPET